MEKMEKEYKKTYLEIMRILAIFFVVFNHTSIRGYKMGLVAENSIQHFIYLIITMITKFNVPIFFMISGALLIGKDETLKDIMKKRVFRFIIVIIIANIIVYLDTLIKNYQINEMNFFNCLKGCFAGMHYSYWFLYAYLSALLMLPFIRIIGQEINKELFIYLLLIHFIFSSLVPLINVVFDGKFNISFNESLYLPIMLEKNMFYMLIGYYLEHKCNDRIYKKRYVCIIFILSIIGIAIEVIVTHIQGEKYGFSEAYVQMFDYLIAIFIYVFIKYVCINNKIFDGAIGRLICIVGNCTFGMYLFDPLFQKYQYKIIFYLYQFVPMIVASFGYCLISMTCCGILTWGLKKINYINKLI